MAHVCWTPYSKVLKAESVEMRSPSFWHGTPQELSKCVSRNRHGVGVTEWHFIWQAKGTVSHLRSIYTRTLPTLCILPRQLDKGDKTSFPSPTWLFRSELRDSLLRCRQKCLLSSLAKLTLPPFLCVCNNEKNAHGEEDAPVDPQSQLRPEWPYRRSGHHSVRAYLLRLPHVLVFFLLLFI